jgi:hypothetical protein
MPALLKRGRQTGPDAEGITPDLLRLKFYYSWNFFFFSLSVCLVSCLFVHHLSLLIFWFSIFSSFLLFSLSFLVLLVLLL